MFLCIGNVPLRNLVYRVLELPSSMQSLVYDFGQLSSDTEKDYAVKIVEKYVCNNELLDNLLFITNICTNR